MIAQSPQREEDKVAFGQILREVCHKPPYVQARQPV